jgi:hypothetical protein
VSGTKRLNVFERYLSLWVALCMAAGVALGKLLPGLTEGLRRMEAGDGSHINLPIAVLIWLMIYPMMLKIDLGSLAGALYRDDPPSPDGDVFVGLRRRNIQRRYWHLRTLEYGRPKIFAEILNGISDDGGYVGWGEDRCDHIFGRIAGCLFLTDRGCPPGTVWFRLCASQMKTIKPISSQLNRLPATPPRLP